MKKMCIVFAALIALSGLQAGKSVATERQAPTSPKRNGAKAMKKTSSKKSPVVVRVTEGVFSGEVVSKVLLPFLMQSSTEHETMKARAAQMHRLNVACDKPALPKNTTVYNFKTGCFE